MWSSSLSFAPELVVVQVPLLVPSVQEPYVDEELAAEPAAQRDNGEEDEVAVKVSSSLTPDSDLGLN